MVTETPPSPVNFTASMVVHFVTAVREVFSTMLGTTVTVSSPHQKCTPAPTHDVSALIGLSGQVIGSMVLSFNQSTAVNAAAAFSGTSIPADHPDFPDAIGELANMIAGAAKKHFGASASISVPSIIMGSGHSVARLQNVPCIVIPCSTTFGDFAIEISVKANL